MCVWRDREKEIILALICETKSKNDRSRCSGSYDPHLFNNGQGQPTIFQLLYVIVTKNRKNQHSLSSYNASDILLRAL